MAATAGVAIPIKSWKVLNAGTSNPTMRRLPEKAGQTFLIGTPVRVEAASGFLIANPAIVSVATAIVAGIAAEFGHNLAASGVGASLTYGSVQNQSAAVLIPVGAPLSDGQCGLTVATDENIFIGLLGGSVTDADGTTAQTDVGAIFGLTKDATTNYWYVDKDITTTAGGACVEVVELIDAVGVLHGKVGFRFTHAAQQMNI